MTGRRNLEAELAGLAALQVAFDFFAQSSRASRDKSTE